MITGGKGYRPLLESEIKIAQDISRSAMEAARKLGVSYNTYKRYAKKYDIFDRKKNPTGVGIRRIHSPWKGPYPLKEIMEGQHPNYPTFKYLSRLIRAGVKDKCCEMCGFKEERITDRRVPLIINFKDGNRQNKQIENVEVLCLNCFFLTVGNPWGLKKEYLMESNEPYWHND